uniref:CC126 protein n=1 Tax=Gongylonema pulchrum TaxID=637853 RepID=A0A183DCP8_9BILA
LQSMYEIPNRTMQMAQQIEQLQLRLQYLQQCYMSECHGGVPQNEQQPVSVMQRGSEVQVLALIRVILCFQNYGNRVDTQCKDSVVLMLLKFSDLLERNCLKILDSELRTAS